MPPRLPLPAKAWQLCLPHRALRSHTQPRLFHTSLQCFSSTNDNSNNESSSTTTTPPPGSNAPHDPTQPLLPGVSEEAAALAAVRSGGATECIPPDYEQGTPVSEVLAREGEEGQDKLPEVLKNDVAAARERMKKSAEKAPVRGKRAFSTLVGGRKMETMVTGSTPSAEDVMVPQKQHMAEEVQMGEGAELQITQKMLEGYNPRFEPVRLPMPRENILSKRTDPIITQLIGLIMRHGKKGVAERNVSYILTHLRTSPPPKLTTMHPLPPGTPSPMYLTLNPIAYLTLAIDSIAPLMRMRSERGAGGGGTSIMVPIPLELRQRRRAAIQWILEAVGNKKSRISGRFRFAHRIAEEIVAIVQGTSPLWEKRAGMHRMGTQSRANVGYKRTVKRRFTKK